MLDLGTLFHDRVGAVELLAIVQYALLPETSWRIGDYDYDSFNFAIICAVQAHQLELTWSI